MKLKPEEVILTGRWLFDGSVTRGDFVCERISWLTLHALQRLACGDWGDWEVLYVDPSDGRYWELTCPQGHLQGGGPPQLRALSAVEARIKHPADH